MAFKGTQGNWKIEQDGNSSFVIETEDRCDIASVWIEDEGNGEGEKESEANAKLIACAPKMIDFIKSIALSENTPLVYRKRAENLIKKAT